MTPTLCPRCGWHVDRCKCARPAEVSIGFAEDETEVTVDFLDDRGYVVCGVDITRNRIVGSITNGPIDSTASPYAPRPEPKYEWDPVLGWTVTNFADLIVPPERL